MSASKYTKARLALRGKQVEIFVKPDEALAYRLGKLKDLSEVLLSDEIYLDAEKGLRAPSDLLLDLFQTTDPAKIADRILKEGQLLLTAEQRRRLIDEKRRRIIDFICRNCVDPRTGLPLPPMRVEQAMSQARVSIDPFKSAEEQAKEIISALRSVLPLKIERIKARISVPPEFAMKAYGVVKALGTISSEEWLADGSWLAVVEVSLGSRSSLLERLGKVTQGTCRVSFEHEQS